MHGKKKETEKKPLIRRNLRKKSSAKKEEVRKKEICGEDRGRPIEVIATQQELDEKPEYRAFDALADKAWERYCKGWTLEKISNALNVSVSCVWKRISDRTEYLRDNASPEVAAARTGQLLDSYFDVRNHALEMMRESENSGPAWAAIALKSNELIGKLYGLGNDKGVDRSDVTLANRLQHIASRLALLGPHAITAIADEQRLAFNAVGIPRPSAETVREVVDGNFVVVE